MLLNFYLKRKNPDRFDVAEDAGSWETCVGQGGGLLKALLHDTIFKGESRKLEVGQEYGNTSLHRQLWKTLWAKKLNKLYV